MPYSKAVKMIEDCSNTSDSSKENAKKISKLIYKTFPKIEKEGPLTRLCVFNGKEKGISVEYSNEIGTFCFTCRNDGAIHYYQSLLGRDQWWEQDYEAMPTEKEIVRHLKRKRFPREKHL